MKVTVTLYENDLKSIVAREFNVRSDEVSVKVHNTLVGHGPGEHMEARLDCVEIKIPIDRLATLPAASKIPKITIE